MTALILHAEDNSNEDGDSVENSLSALTELLNVILKVETAIAAEAGQDGSRETTVGKATARYYHGSEDDDWRSATLVLLRRFFAVRLRRIWEQFASISNCGSGKVGASGGHGCNCGSGFGGIKEISSFNEMNSLNNTAKDVITITFASADSNRSRCSMRLPRDYFSRLSPAFAAMISGQSFVEGSAGQVYFPNITAQEFRLFLRLFIQTGVKKPRCRDRLNCDNYCDNEARDNGELLSNNCFLDAIHDGDGDGFKNRKVDQYQQVDDALQSMSAVLHFTHQYLVDNDALPLEVDGKIERKDEGGRPSNLSSSDQSEGWTSRSSRIADQLFLLIANIVINHGDYVRLSTLSDVVHSLQLICDEEGVGDDRKARKITHANVCAPGKVRSPGLVSDARRRSSTSISKAINDSKRLLNTCKIVVRFVVNAVTSKACSGQQEA